MRVTFTHEGREWEARGTGSGSGFAMGRLPQPTSYQVLFRALDGSGEESVGYIHKADPNDVPDRMLRQALEKALTEER